MQSSGQWHRLVPKGFIDNLLFRQKILKLASNPSRQAALIKACSEDILFFINVFCFTYDPRTKLKLLPFITWAFQDEALLEILECIEEGTDLVIEKSRDMGASWMCMMAMLWLWRFHRGQSFLAVSRKEDLVDSIGDPDSLFWKIDFVLQHCPDWLKGKYDRRSLHFGNPAMGSTINGEATTKAAGVGGRRTAMFIDEFSRIERGADLLAGTADTTRCRIFNFTPWGTNNAAYALARRHDVKKLRLHWSKHPEKSRGLYQYSDKDHQVQIKDPSYQFAEDYRFRMDGRLRSPWYDAECDRRANDREIAQMLDIDYQGSAYQFFERNLIQLLQATYCVDPFWEGDIAFEPDTGKPLGLIAGSNGPLKLWFNPDPYGNPPRSLYAAGCDISTGTGCTNSCITIADGKTGEKVAEYVSPYLKAEQLALRATALCWLFKDADSTPTFLAWEQCGPGILFGKRIIELDYAHYYVRPLSESAVFAKQGTAAGWYPSADNKRMLLEEYRFGLSSRQFVNRSHAALDECLEFIHTTKGTVEHAQENNDSDPTGARVNHGDRTIADAICWKMVKSFGMVGPIKEQKATMTAPVGSLAYRREMASARTSGWEESRR